MQDVLKASHFDFPYTNLRFSGMNTGERILFVTRESKVMLGFRFLVVVLIVLALIIVGVVLLSIAQSVFLVSGMVYLVFLLICCVFGVIGFWWVSEIFRKSVFIVTTRRLTKIIHTTPFTWYQFSLGLDEIQDTGSYASTYFEALFHLGYFVARSGAGAVKNFKIVNITFSQDLHNYVNKLLYTFKHHPDKMHLFRPFIPHLKGEKRAEFLKKYPEYRTEF